MNIKKTAPSAGFLADPPTPQPRKSGLGCWRFGAWVENPCRRHRVWLPSFAISQNLPLYRKAQTAGTEHRGVNPTPSAILRFRWETTNGKP